MSVTLNTKHLSSFINEEEYEAIYPQVEAAHNQLEAKTGPGNDFLGWMYLPRDYDKEEFARIKEAAAKIREDSDVLVVAGIGGSYLGARAVIEAVKGQFHNELENGLKIYFCGNSISPTYLNNIINLCKGKRFSINVISKSGTTTETSLAFRVLRELLEKRGTLRSLAATEEDSVYRLYYDFSQPIARLQGHQILAVNRGEREGFLKVTLETDREQALICVRRCVLVPGGGAAAFLRAASGPQEPGRVLYYNDQPSDFIYYQGLAQRAMGNEAAARKAFHKLLTYGETHLFDAVAYDFFAVSLPEIEVFADDIALRNRQYCNYLRALGCAGLGRTSEAAELFAGILELQPDDQGALRHA